MARLICPHCPDPKPAGRQWCEIHRTTRLIEAADAPERPESAGAAAVPPPAAVPAASPESCWRCERPVAHPDNSRCADCHSPLVPPALVLRPEDGRVITVERDGQVQLGRCPDWSPHAATFAAFSNVSRQHATVGVDTSGAAWIRPEDTTNGTFQNDRELPPETPARLADGDQLRFGNAFTATVRIHPTKGSRRDRTL